MEELSTKTWIKLQTYSTLLPCPGGGGARLIMATPIVSLGRLHTCMYTGELPARFLLLLDKDPKVGSKLCRYMTHALTCLVYIRCRRWLFQCYLWSMTSHDVTCFFFTMTTSATVSTPWGPRWWRHWWVHISTSGLPLLRAFWPRTRASVYNR